MVQSKEQEQYEKSFLAHVMTLEKEEHKRYMMLVAAESEINNTIMKPLLHHFNQLRGIAMQITSKYPSIGKDLEAALRKARTSINSIFVFLGMHHKTIHALRRIAEEHSKISHLLENVSNANKQEIAKLTKSVGVIRKYIPILQEEHSTIDDAQEEIEAHVKTLYEAYHLIRDTYLSKDLEKPMNALYAKDARLYKAFADCRNDVGHFLNELPFFLERMRMYSTRLTIVEIHMEQEEVQALGAA